jgi:hypothetical protein
MCLTHHNMAGLSSLTHANQHHGMVTTAAPATQSSEKDPDCGDLPLHYNTAVLSKHGTRNSGQLHVDTVDNIMPLATTLNLRVLQASDRAPRLRC